MSEAPAYGRKAQLAGMGFATYSAYMRSSRWAETKRRYRASSMPQVCRICAAPMVDLHHRSYKNVGNERLHDLVPLCRAHHDELHNLLRDARRDQWWALTRTFIKGQRKRRRKRGMTVGATRVKRAS